MSWFKDTAIDHIAEIRQLVAILENHGVHVRTLKAKRVGYVVYEDQYQIVAEWDEVKELLQGSYTLIAPRRLAEQVKAEI